MRLRDAGREAAEKEIISATIERHDLRDGVILIVMEHDLWILEPGSYSDAVCCVQLAPNRKYRWRH